MRRGAVGKISCNIRCAFSVEDNVAIDLLRLISGCNDLRNALRFMDAACSKGLLTGSQYPKENRIYFLRLVYGHLYETLKVFDELKKSREANELINSSDEAKQVFEKLKKVLKEKSIKKQMGLFRNNTIFHYNSDHFRESLDWWHNNRKKAEDVRPVARIKEEMPFEVEFPISEDLMPIILFRICKLDVEEFKSLIAKAKEITMLLEELALHLLEELVQKR